MEFRIGYATSDTYSDTSISHYHTWITQTTDFPSIFCQEYRRITEGTHPGCRSTWRKICSWISFIRFSVSRHCKGSDGEWRVLVLAWERLWTILPARLGDDSTDNGRNNLFPPGIDMSESTGYAKSKDPVSFSVFILRGLSNLLFSLLT